MFETVFLLVGALLAIYGLCQLCYALYLRFLVSAECRKIYTVILLKEQTACEQMQYAVCERNWNGNTFAERLLVCYEQLSDEKLAECARVCQENGFCLCKKEQLADFLTRMK